MKKWIAALLAMLLLLSLLVGCSSKNEDNDDDEKTSQSDKNKDDKDKKPDKNDDEDPTKAPVKDPTQTPTQVPTQAPTQTPTPKPTEPVDTGVAIGTILDRPEKIYNGKLDSFYLKVIQNGTTSQSMDIHVQGLQGESGVIALTRNYNGTYAGIVVEIGANDTFAVYNRTKLSDPYVLDTTMTKEDVEDLAEGLSEIIKLFIARDWDAEDAQLRKTTAANEDVYTYEILQNGTAVSTLSVDKETGLIVDLDGDGERLTITDFHLTDARLPLYK